MNEENHFHRLSRRIEELIARIEAAPDSNARADALSLARSLMELHGAGLDRLMEIVAQSGATGYALMDDFVDDGLVAGLLLLHGLHPYNLETRVMKALDETRPFLQSHGGDVELLGVTGGTVRLRLVGNCRNCSSSTMTLKLAIERAIYEAAPDVTEIVAEGQIAMKEPATANGLVQLTVKGETHG
ncbi:MAG TPA: NifU family protein [Blastocatellia bacterium]